MSVIVTTTVLAIPVALPALRLTSNVHSLWTAYYDATGGWVGGPEALATVPWDGDLPRVVLPAAPAPILFVRD